MVKLKEKKHFKGRCSEVKDTWDLDKLGLKLSLLHRYGFHRKTSRWKRCLWCCLYVFSRQWVKMLVFVVVMVALLCHLYKVGIHKSVRHHTFGPSEVCSEQTKRKSYRRRVVWEKACLNLNFPSSRGAYSPYFSDKARRFVFCSVPEVGDTFWKGVIRYVNNASKTVHGRAVDIPRWQTYFVAPTSLHNTLGSTIIFLYSEDPFVRLWRIWVEKFYLNAYWFKKAPGFKVPSTECQLDFKFTEFVSMITTDYHLDYYDQLNVHWRPQFDLCDVCSMRPNYFAKMETFEEDTRCILSMTKYDWTLRETETRENRDKSSKSSKFSMKTLKFRQASLRHMQSLTQENLARWRSSRGVQQCIKERDLVLRLWQGFKLLGYLPMRANISQAFWGKKEVKIEDFLLECLHASLMWRGRTAKERQEKREKESRELMVQAYKEVDSGTMNSIVRLYSKDFQLLNYPPQPEDLFPRKKNEEEKGQ